MGRGGDFYWYYVELYSMKIVADEKIPLIEHYFKNYGELILKNGREISRNDVLSADMLIVRSVTPVNRTLLEGSQVKFVGSVATGLDHLDLNWLKQAGVSCYAAQGCNAIAVVEYVICVIAALQKKGFLVANSLRAAVVGVGNIGSKVVEKLKILGFDVLQCDPIKAKEDANFFHTPLEQINDVDLICLHTPLTSLGSYPTYHMIDKAFLQKQKPNCVLLNAGRGSVINFADLKLYGERLVWVLDVWENEPRIDVEIMDIAAIATPHIAGHSLQSKYRAIQMVHDNFVRQGVLLPEKVLPIDLPRKDLYLNKPSPDWRDVVLSIYNPLLTTLEMKQAIIEKGAIAFDALRNAFNKYEFASVHIKDLPIHFSGCELWQNLDN